MTHSVGEAWIAAVRLLASAGLLLLTLAGCASSAKSPNGAVDAAPDARASTDTTPAGEPDGSGAKTDAVAADTAIPLGDAVAADAGPGDAQARDTADLRADAAALETGPDRVAGPDVTGIRADAAAAEVQPPLPDAEKPGADTVFRGDASPAEAAGTGPETSLPGCNLDGGASLVRLTALELKTLLDGGEDPFLINVKGAAIGSIPGTDAVLVNDIPGIEALVGGDHCANIILYCQSGATSQGVANQLIAKGYVHVRDLSGGITAWKNAGYPTE